jgi:3-oxoacyl-[acyl-carrier-protein] synthase-3
MSPEDIDFVFVGTMSADYHFPSTACVVSDALGIHGAGAIDMSAACSGFIYGLMVCDAMIRAGSVRNILLISGEKNSNIVDWTDRSTCVLFGDGAGAAVITGSDEPGIIGVNTGADGALADLIIIPAGGSRRPASHETVDQRLHYLTMQGRKVYAQAVRVMESRLLEALDSWDLSIKDIDVLIPHQANLRIMESAARNLGFPREQMFCNVQRYGNTSAATIPIAIHEALHDGLIQPGCTIACVGFGAGFTWGTAVFRWV